MRRKRYFRHYGCMGKTRHMQGHVHHRHPVLKKHPLLRKNYCFGCGKDNPQGMRLKFAYDEEGKRFVSHFRLGRRYTGPPGHAHGGIIAAILDEAMSKPSRLRNVIAPTVELKIEYLKAVPLGKKITAFGWERRVRGRQHYRAAEIRNEAGELLARAQGKFIAVDPERIMAKFLGNDKPKN